MGRDYRQDRDSTLTTMETSDTLPPMKANTLTESITFRVGKLTLEVLDKLAEREDRKRADVARRIFMKALQREAAKASK